MRHGRKTKKLGRTYEHRRALLRNLARSLFTHGRIRTTVGKAKAARQFVERLISYAKQNSLDARRRLFAHLGDHGMAVMVTEKIGPLFAARSGGYTRIYLLGRRLGDGAEMAILELVERPVVEGAEKAKEKKEEKREAPKTGKKPVEKAEAKKPEARKPEKKGAGKTGKEESKKAKEEAKKSRPVARPEKPKKAVNEKKV